MTKKLKFLCYLALCLFCSCTKTEIKISDPEKAIPGSYAEIFEAFWNGMNQNYVYWDIDKNKVDWDQIYRDFKPKFSQLNMNNTSDLQKGKEYLKEMTKNLSDGHFAITFNHPDLLSDTIFPSRERNRQIVEKTISNNKLLFDNPNQYFDSGKTSLVIDGNSNLSLLSGTIKNRILYLHFNAFYLTENYSKNLEIKKLLDSFFEQISNQQFTSVIVDLRNNSGGDVSDLNFLFGRMVQNQTHFGYVKYKLGNNRMDYAPELNTYLLPLQSTNSFKKPVIILVNRNTVSMAEVSLLALKTLPGTVLVGEKTFGALGLLVNNNTLYNGGSFKVSTFLTVTTSTASIWDLQHKSFEGSGIIPDKIVKFENMNQDEQLAYAINLTQNK